MAPYVPEKSDFPTLLAAVTQKPLRLRLKAPNIPSSAQVDQLSSQAAAVAKSNLQSETVINPSATEEEKDIPSLLAAVIEKNRLMQQTMPKYVPEEDAFPSLAASIVKETRPPRQKIPPPKKIVPHQPQVEKEENEEIDETPSLIAAVIEKARLLRENMAPYVPEEDDFPSLSPALVTPPEQRTSRRNEPSIAPDEYALSQNSGLNFSDLDAISSDEGVSSEDEGLTSPDDGFISRIGSPTSTGLQSPSSRLQRCRFTVDFGGETPEIALQSFMRNILIVDREADELPTGFEYESLHGGRRIPVYAIGGRLDAPLIAGKSDPMRAPGSGRPCGALSGLERYLCVPTYPELDLFPISGYQM